MSEFGFMSDEEIGLFRREKTAMPEARERAIFSTRNDQLKELDRELEQIIGGSVDFLPFSFLEEGVARGNSVARVEVRKQTPVGPQVLGHGTGFLVAPDLLMTNNHVLPEAAVAADSRIQFRYEIDIFGAEKDVDSWTLDPDSFFVTSPKTELDFALVRVAPKAERMPGETYGFVPLQSVDRFKVGERINVVQHPKGRRKEVVLYENKVTGFFEEDYVHYEADTLKGSSGSPVFNQQWDLVALHHSGVFKKDENGDYVVVDGEYVYVANEGVRISKIVDHLRSDKVSDPQRAEIAQWIF